MITNCKVVFSKIIFPIHVVVFFLIFYLNRWIQFSNHSQDFSVRIEIMMLYIFFNACFTGNGNTQNTDDLSGSKRLVD